MKCLDSLVALLTKPDLLPDCNHERCTVCVLTHSHGCMDGWTDLCGGNRYGSVLSSLSVFKKGENGEAEAQTQASLSALKGCGPGGERTRIQAESTQGAHWPL